MATSGKDTKSTERTQKAQVAPAPKKPATRKTPPFDEAANNMISEGDITGLPENDFNPYDEVRPRVDPQRPDRSTPERSGFKN
ncbi:MAG: hypothetical protein KF767_00710 [Bdellovibrionaceae bacterium]|nr:hypothetical protein [Pseudobdellovibrionaceae bacterium]